MSQNSSQTKTVASSNSASDTGDNKIENICEEKKTHDSLTISV